MSIDQHIVLSCAQLGKTYAQGRHKLTVLEHVDLTVTRGERLAIVGVSGSGKSTVLRAICGLAPIHAGSVKLSGEGALPAESRAPTQAARWVPGWSDDEIRSGC